jgi:hypothetical protein
MTKSSKVHIFSFGMKEPSIRNLRLARDGREVNYQVGLQAIFAAMPVGHFTICSNGLKYDN